MNYESNNLKAKVIATCLFSLFFISSSLGIMIFLPADGEHYTSSKAETKSMISVREITEEYFADLDAKGESQKVEMDVSKKDDPGLALYRQPQSKAAVEWFYSRLTENREVAQAILVSADEFNIPLPLAFSLAHTESNYKATAIHKNTNGSIDRGLFQLNDNSFPTLGEEDFYNPRTSAHYGLSHLNFCIKSAGNEIAALAMYNAGTNKVKKNSTPQITLNYISQIQNYKAAIEENFAVEVLSLYNSENTTKFLASYR